MLTLAPDNEEPMLSKMRKLLAHMRPMPIDTAKLVLRPVPEGHRVRLKHLYRQKPNRPKVLYRTEAYVERQTAPGQYLIVADGYSQVRDGDTPNKKLGRAIAHNRAIKNMLKGHPPQLHLRVTEESKPKSEVDADEDVITQAKEVFS